MSPICNFPPAHSHNHLFISPGRRTIVHVCAGCTRKWRVESRRYSLSLLLGAALERRIDLLHIRLSPLPSICCLHTLVPHCGSRTFKKCSCRTMKDKCVSYSPKPTSPPAWVASPLGRRGHPRELGQMPRCSSPVVHLPPQSTTTEIYLLRKTYHNRKPQIISSDLTLVTPRRNPHSGQRSSVLRCVIHV